MANSLTSIHRRLATVLFVAFFLAGSHSKADDQLAAGLRAVGVARVDITPDYPVRLSGFGFRRTESEGIRQRIWAKALAIGADDDRPAVLIAVDYRGIPDRMRSEERRGGIEGTAGGRL